MSTTTGPDGLTDEERHWRAHNQREASNVGTAAWYFDFALVKLGRERLAHAETRARAEKAEAERDRLRAALVKMVDAIGPLESHSAASVIEDSDVLKAHYASIAARALLGEVKP
jgi:hypothetical protein